MAGPKRGESYDEWQRRRADDRLAFTARLREVDGLVEQSPGRFSFRSRAFFHFHGGDRDRVADVRLGDDWVRLPAETAADLERIRKRVVAHVAAAPPKRRR